MKILLIIFPKLFNNFLILKNAFLNNFFDHNNYDIHKNKFEIYAKIIGLYVNLYWSWIKYIKYWLIDYGYKKMQYQSEIFM